MKNIVPRVAAIHGLAGFGRASLAVIMPVLGAMGVQACPLPTAVLSTHTGGFGLPFFHDLTDTMGEYASHWQGIGLDFDCIYTGFLASEKQIDLAGQFLSDFRTEGQLIVVDPVMGDNGKLYSTYTPEMAVKMGLLVEKADLITPNLTEASLLLNKPYFDNCIDTKALKILLNQLAGLGPESVIITGVRCADGNHANVGYQRLSHKYWRVKYKHLPVSYPGTGDIFSSVLIGGLLRGDSLPMAMGRATQFLSLAVQVTFDHGGITREGVVLEKVISWLGKDPIHCSYEMLT